MNYRGSEACESSTLSMHCSMLQLLWQEGIQPPFHHPQLYISNCHLFLILRCTLMLSPLEAVSSLCLRVYTGMCVCVSPIGFGGTEQLCEVILKILESLYHQRSLWLIVFQKYFHAKYWSQMLDPRNKMCWQARQYHFGSVGGVIMK